MAGHSLVVQWVILIPHGGHTELFFIAAKFPKVV